MARPDVRFNTAAPPPVPRVDLDFADPERVQEPHVIDLRDRPSLSDAEARAILGVALDAAWDAVSDAYAARIGQLDDERHQINTAYATLRLLSSF